MQRLKIDELRDFGMCEDVVALADPAQLEAQCFGEAAQAKATLVTAPRARDLILVESSHR